MLLRSQRDGKEDEIPLRPPPNIHSPLSSFFCTQALLCLLCPSFLSFALIEVSLRFLVLATSEGCISADLRSFFLGFVCSSRVAFPLPSSCLSCQRNQSDSDAFCAASHIWLYFSPLTELDLNRVLVV